MLNPMRDNIEGTNRGRGGEGGGTEDTCDLMAGPEDRWEGKISYEVELKSKTDGFRREKNTCEEQTPCQVHIITKFGIIDETPLRKPRETSKTQNTHTKKRKNKTCRVAYAYI